LKNLSAETASPFLPNIKNKYYTRSTLVKNLFPMPSEGKVRAKFVEPPASLTKSSPFPVKRSQTLGRAAQEILMDISKNSPVLNRKSPYLSTD
jgi:hypothetical protein